MFFPLWDKIVKEKNYNPNKRWRRRYQLAKKFYRCNKIYNKDLIQEEFNSDLFICKIFL